MFLTSLLTLILSIGTPSESSDTIPQPKIYSINSITLAGNKTTKDYIIYRELMFAINDTLEISVLEQKVKQSRTNLLNTSLFNFVTITSTPKDSNKLDINISLVERWYTWPVPIFEIAERNFNTWLLTKDLSRANYGFYINRENFRGRKELISLKVRLGYSEQYGISYQIPYIDKKRNSGLGIAAYYSRSHEMAYGSRNNLLQFYKNINNYVRSGFSSTLRYTLRKGIYNTHTAELAYTNESISDTITKINSDYFKNGKINQEYLTLNYVFKRDRRDPKAYPLKGYYIGFQTIKYGIGVLKNETLNAFFIESVLKKYWNLGHKLYLASSVKGRVSLIGNQPYYVQRALGYGDIVRGYEYYVVDGGSYALMKSALKYEFIKPRVKKFPYLTNEKFNTFHYALYGGIFADAGYVKNTINYQNNNLTNSFLMGFGVGLDFVTYYDLVFRIEYSFNTLWQHTYFPHIGPPI